MSDAHSKWVNGALVWYDQYEYRWLDAVGADVKKFIEDFTAPLLVSSLLAGWTNTAVEAGTGSSTHIAQDEAGGVVRWNAAANENDGLQSQTNGEAWKLETDKPLYFGCRWNISEKTQSDALIGLALTDASVIGVPNDFIGFVTHDGDANLDYQCRAGGTGAAVDSTTDLVDDTFIVTEFFYDGAGNIEFFVDGVSAAKVSTNIPTGEMRVSVAYLNGTGTMQNDGLEVDWIRCIQCR